MVRPGNPPARLDLATAWAVAGGPEEGRGVLRLLHNLTAGRFHNGAVHRVLAMEFWTRGEAPTFEEFARSWTRSEDRGAWAVYAGVHLPKGRKHQRAGDNWKALRTAKATSALKTLARMVPT